MIIMSFVDIAKGKEKQIWFLKGLVCTKKAVQFVTAGFFFLLAYLLSDQRLNPNNTPSPAENIKKNR